MRTKLRVAALIIALVILAFWFFGGPNLGWTKTSVPRTEKDPVTEIEKVVYEGRFVPGIDFLFSGLAVAALISASSFFIKDKPATEKEACPTCSCSH